jgi:hypothetical protein
MGMGRCEERMEALRVVALAHRKAGLVLQEDLFEAYICIAVFLTTNEPLYALGTPVGRDWTWESLSTYT